MVWYECAKPALADELGKLVLAGVKTVAWRLAHTRYFGQHCTHLEFEFSPEILVMCACFPRVFAL